MNTKSTWIWHRAEWPDLAYDAQMTAPDLAAAYRIYTPLNPQ